MWYLQSSGSSNRRIGFFLPWNQAGDPAGVHFWGGCHAASIARLTPYAKCAILDRMASERLALRRSSSANAAPETVLTEPGRQSHGSVRARPATEVRPGSASTISDAARLLATRSSRGHPQRTPHPHTKLSACPFCGEIHGVRAMQRHRAAYHATARASRKSLKTQDLQ